MPSIWGIYIDKSKLRKAWQKYYSNMNLSASKMITVMNRRMAKGVMPTA